MAAREVPDRFAVAFSLAGEQRHLVLPIAQRLEAVLGPSTVFYDDWFEHYIAGADADVRLQAIYGRSADLVVVCVSDAYGEKAWTRTEHRAVRARQMRATTDAERMAILPMRFGDGDVAGIEFNDVVPDVRTRTAADSAELILARLRLVRGGTTSAPVVGSAGWLDAPPELHWPMADHTEAQEAFAELLCAASTVRALLVRGASGTGKSHMATQMDANVGRLLGVAGGRFDFKGTTETDVDALCAALDVDPPEPGPLSRQLSTILRTLRQRARPTVLILDTFEHAANEDQKWVQQVLLGEVGRADWLRVVVIGQAVPDRASQAWGGMARPVLDLTLPSADHWHEFGRKNRGDDLEFEFVEQVYQLAGGSPSYLAPLLGPRS